jgi:hypothetical protein
MRRDGYTAFSLFKIHGIQLKTLYRIQRKNEISRPIYEKIKNIFHVSDIELLGVPEAEYKFLPVGKSGTGRIASANKLVRAKTEKYKFGGDNLEKSTPIDYPVPNVHPPMPERRRDETFEEYYWRLRSGV